MTPERQAYARKRVERLSVKIEDITARLCEAAKGTPDNPANTVLCDALIKQRRSAVQSRKRWLKELGVAS